MKLISGPALNVIIFLVILALLIFVAWLLGKLQKKKYHDDAVEYMLRPERAPVILTWGEISDAADNGVMTCNTSCELEERTDQVQLTVYGKDRSIIENFTQNVKFQFSPIYTQPPVDIFQRLWMAVNTQRTPSTKSSKDKSPSPDSIVLDSYDLLLEFGMKTDYTPITETKKDGVNSQDKNKPYFAVGFNIDPTIKRIHALGRCPTPIKCTCNRKDSYCSKEKNIRVTVSVSVGGIDAVLESLSLILKAVQSKTMPPLSNPNGYTKTLYIGGRELNDNTYGLTGTWYA